MATSGCSDPSALPRSRSGSRKRWTLNLAAARLRHNAGTKWSTKRYINMQLLKQRDDRLTGSAVNPKVRKIFDTTFVLSSEPAMICVSKGSRQRICPIGNPMLAGLVKPRYARPRQLRHHHRTTASEKAAFLGRLPRNRVKPITSSLQPTTTGFPNHKKAGFITQLSWKNFHRLDTDTPCTSPQYRVLHGRPVCGDRPP